MKNYGINYYVSPYLKGAQDVSLTKTGKLIRLIDSSGDSYYFVNSSSNRKVLSRHGWWL